MANYALTAPGRAALAAEARRLKGAAAGGEAPPDGPAVKRMLV